MKSRIKFVLEWERRFRSQEGQLDVAELCRVHGVSRQTGYVWIKRYETSGYDLRVMDERSCKPHTSPHAVSPEVLDFIVAARKARPPAQITGVVGPANPRGVAAEHQRHEQDSSGSRPQHGGPWRHNGRPLRTLGRRPPSLPHAYLRVVQLGQGIELPASWITQVA